MAKGWIALHRQLQCHWLWDDKPFARGQAWTDMLMMANHADRKFLFGNELVEVKSGSFITSEQKLMERWGWKSRHKVRNFLELLESEHMIELKRDNKKTAITIENYSVYQGVESNTGHQKDNNGTSKNGDFYDFSDDDDSEWDIKRTGENVEKYSVTEVGKKKTGHQKDTKRTSKGQRRDTNNNDNNDNNDNKYIYIVDYLNEKAGTKFRSSSKKTRTLIHARVAEGFTVEDFEQVIDKKCKDWIGTDWEKFLRPETLFGTKFEGYLNAKQTNKKNQQKQNTGISQEEDDLEGIF